MAESPLDALALLTADNRKIAGMFGRVERQEVSGVDKEVLVGNICRALMVQAEIMEDIAYPAFRAAGVHDWILDHAAMGQDAIRHLIDDLQHVSHKDPLFDARVKSLAYKVRRRVKSDETELFPDAQRSGVDLVALGRKLEARKGALMAGADLA